MVGFMPTVASGTWNQATAPRPRPSTCATGTRRTPRRALFPTAPAAGTSGASRRFPTILRCRELFAIGLVKAGPLHSERARGRQTRFAARDGVQQLALQRDRREQ